MDPGYLHGMAGNVASSYCSMEGIDDDLTYDLLVMIRQVMWPAVTVVWKA